MPINKAAGLILLRALPILAPQKGQKGVFLSSLRPQAPHLKFIYRKFSLSTSTLFDSPCARSTMICTLLSMPTVSLFKVMS